MRHEHTCEHCHQTTVILLEDGPLVAVLNRIHFEQRKLRELMTTADQNIDAITAKVEESTAGVATLATAFTDLAADVRAVLATPRGEVSPETQAKFDTLSATLDASSATAAQALSDLAALDAEVGDADGSDGTPTPPVER